MTRHMLAGLLFATALLAGAPVHAAVVSQLNIMGGSVGFNVAIGNSQIPIFSGDFTQTGTLLMGQYQAANGPTPVFPTFTIGSGPLAHTFSIFTNPGNGPNPLPTPSGNTIGNTIEVNLNALFAGISGPIIHGGLNIGNQLPALAAGTYNPGTGAFHLAWDHVYSLPDDFVGIGNFSLNGTAALAPVPLPAAAVLFVTGLAGLGGLAGRRRYTRG